MRARLGLVVAVGLAAVVPAVPASARTPAPPEVTSTCGGTSTNYNAPAVMPAAGPVAGIAVPVGIYHSSAATWTSPSVKGGKRAVVNAFAGLSIGSTAAATRIAAGVRYVGDNSRAAYVEFTSPGMALQFAPQFTVNVGDEIDASASHVGRELRAAFANHTTGATCDITIALRAKGSQHFMWAGVERETSSDGSAKPLANFGTMSFAANVPALSGNHWRDSIIPETSIVSGSHVLAEPAPYANGKFAVYWRRAT